MKAIYKSILVLAVLSLFTRVANNPFEKSKKNDGLKLPRNFEVIVVADSLGSARHIAINTNGDIYVKLRRSYLQGSNVALRDTNGDGKADIIKFFGVYEDNYNYGTAMRINNGYLYYSSSEQIFRSKLIPGQLLPDKNVELILTDDFKKDPMGHSHTAKPLTFDDAGNMYVPFGSPSDVCQLRDRVPGQMGQDPCPQLAEHAGVWVFNPNIPNQTIKNGKRYATGIRSAVAINWNNLDSQLYLVQHGRDDLYRSWPELYSRWQSALLPAEEFLRIKEGSDAGWPYYYYDQIQKKKLLNPEYGGDGKKVGKGDQYLQPIIGFPGHFAPNDILFYTGNQFPDHYKNGAFIAFHGSTIRAPYSQGGYFVAFIPFINGKFSEKWEVFVDGFSGDDALLSTSDATYRPMGLAQGPDGSLFISDSQKGRIWQIKFKGNKEKFRSKDLFAMEKRKNNSHIRNPEEFKDKLQSDAAVDGEQVYNSYCGACHLRNGLGDGQRFPPLVNSDFIKGENKPLIKALLLGIEGEITVQGIKYNGVMPSHSFLNNKDIASVLNYIRIRFNKNIDEISPKEVELVRNSLGK